MPHSRLHVLVTWHQALRSKFELLRTCTPMSSITSSGSESKPVILGLVYVWEMLCECSSQLPEGYASLESISFATIRKLQTCRYLIASHLSQRQLAML